MKKNQNFIFKGGRIIDPSQKIDSKEDLFIVDGKIAESAGKDAQIIDCKNKIVCPGFIDIHVHLRQPGGTAKETIKTGTAAAAAGGFSTIVAMPNTSPKVDSPATVELVRRICEKEASVNVLLTGCLTKNSEGKEMAGIGALARSGVVALTDDGKCVQDHKLMRNIVEYAKNFNLPIMDHCEDEILMGDGVVHEGYWSIVLGMKGIPSEAEEMMVIRNILLARKTQWKIHLQHISAKGSVEWIRNARTNKVPITAEVTPHHIALTDVVIKQFDTNYKMNPPVRTEEDRLALIAGLKDGTISVLATDHAPHTWTEKMVEFDYAPFGIIGLETAIPVTFTELVQTKHLTLSQWVEKWTTGPASVLGKEELGTLRKGVSGNVTVIDPKLKFVINPDTFKSKSRNTPFAGYQATGKAILTMVNGNIAYHDND